MNVEKKKNHWIFSFLVQEKVLTLYLVKRLWIAKTFDLEYRNTNAVILEWWIIDLFYSINVTLFIHSVFSWEKKWREKRAIQCYKTIRGGGKGRTQHRKTNPQINIPWSWVTKTQGSCQAGNFPPSLLSVNSRFHSKCWFLAIKMELQLAHLLLNSFSFWHMLFLICGPLFSPQSPAHSVSMWKASHCFSLP